MSPAILSWRTDINDFSEGHDVSDASFVLYFGPNEVIASSAFQAALRARSPTAQIMGCTTHSFINGPLIQDDAAFAVAVRLNATEVRLVSSDISFDTSYAVGKTLGEALSQPGLAGVFLLCDSLNVDGTALVDGLRGKLSAGIPISGGLASDGADFQKTMVGANDAPRERFVAALGLYGDRVILNQGCAHGWDVFGPPRRITRSEGTELLELDGEPALDLYKRYLGEDAKELPGAALRFPLLVSNPEDPSEVFVRTVLGVDQDKRTLSFAASIPQGWTARLMRGVFANLAQGAGDAARAIARDPQGSSGGLALLVSCVGRRIAMGVETEDETEAAAEVLTPHFTQVGFYSHGEISAKAGERLGGLHNQTMTIFSIEEVA